jgi:hypothetical protein
MLRPGDYIRAGHQRQRQEQGSEAHTGLRVSWIRAALPVVFTGGGLLNKVVKAAF